MTIMPTRDSRINRSRAKGGDYVKMDWKPKSMADFPAGPWILQRVFKINAGHYKLSVAELTGYGE